MNKRQRSHEPMSSSNPPSTTTPSLRPYDKLDDIDVFAETVDLVNLCTGHDVAMRTVRLLKPQKGSKQGLLLFVHGAGGRSFQVSSVVPS